jgi:hypothetical protein
MEKPPPFQESAHCDVKVYLTAMIDSVITIVVIGVSLSNPRVQSDLADST